MLNIVFIKNIKYFLNKFISLFMLKKFIKFGYKTNYISYKSFSNLHMIELSKEKYSLQEIEKIIRIFLKLPHRDINKLPVEFRNYENFFIQLENPIEPEEYECCGKGCTPCVWTIYENKESKLDDLINDLYEKVNNFH